MSAISTTIPAELDCANGAPAGTENRPLRSTSQRAEALHQLIAGVHADVGAYCNLRDLLEAQFEAALRHDTTRLTDIGNAITSQVAKLETQRATRLALVQQLLTHRHATPAAMLALFGIGPRQIAQELWHTLEGLARECQLINTRNGRLLMDQYSSLQRVLAPQPAEAR